MAGKDFTTTFKLLGDASSLVNALSSGSNALRAFKAAATGSFGKAFTDQYNQLNQNLAKMRQAQAAIARLNEIQTRPIGKSGLAAHLNEIQRLKSTIAGAGYSLNSLGAAQLHLKSQIDQATAALTRQNEAINRLQNARNAHNAAGDQLNSAYGNLSNAIDTARQITSPFVDATKTAMTYEAALSRTKALTQMDNIAKGDLEKIDRQMAMLDARYKEIGRTTKFSATQAANAGNFLAMAGWDAQKINAGLPSVVNLSLAAGSDVESAADIMSNIMSGFGIDASEDQIQRVADVLAYTTTHSNQNLQQLGDTMKYVAPVAKMFGSNLEETAALTKFMADAGIQGSMAGTSLRATMLRLVAPPKKASKAMQENGITVNDAMKAWQNANEMAAEYGIKLDETASPGRQMAQVIDQISKNMAGLSAHEKMAAFGAITGINAVSGAMNIFEQPPELINKFVESLETCGGAAKQTADVMADNTEGAFISLQSAIEAVEISVGGALLPALRSALEGATEIARAFSVWAGENPQIVQGFAAIAAAVAAGVVSLAGFRLALAGINFASTSIELIKASQAFRAVSSSGALIAGLAPNFAAAQSAIAGAARAAMSFAFTPIGAAVAALAVAAYMIYQNWDAVAPFFENLWARVSSSFQNAVQSISNAMQAVKAAIVNAFGGQVNFDRFVSRVQSFAKAVGTAIMGLAMIVADAVAGIVATLTNLATGNFAEAAKSAQETFSSIGDTVKGLMDGSIMKGTHTFRNAASVVDQKSDASFAESQKKSAATFQTRIGEVRSALPTATSDDDLKGLIAAATKAVDASTKTISPKLQESLARTMAAVGDKVKSSESAEVQAQWAALSSKYQQTSAAVDAQFKFSEKLSSLFDKAADTSDKRSSNDAAWLIAEMSKAAKSTQDQAMFADTLQKFAADAQSKTSTDSQRAIIEAVRAAQHEVRDRADAGAKAEDQAKAVATLTESMKSFVELAAKSKTDADDQAVLSKVQAAITQSKQIESAETHAALGNAIQAAIMASMSAGAPAQMQTALSKLADQQSQVQAQTQMIGELRGFMEQAKGAETFDDQRQLISSLQSFLSQQTADTGQETARLAEAMSGVLENFKPSTEAESKVAETITAAIGEMQSQAATQMTAQLQTLLDQSNTADEAQQAAIAEQISALTAEMSTLAQNPALQETISAGINDLVSQIVPATEFQAQMLQALGDQTMAAAAEQTAAMSNLGAEVSASSGNITSSISAAASQISSAVSAISINVQNITQAAATASNALGGIYPRGEFLTTFAERSPEAAIPIDGSRRSIELWQRTGALLGVYPTSSMLPVEGSLSTSLDQLKINQAAAAPSSSTSMNAPITVNVSLNVSGDASNPATLADAARSAFESAADEFRRLFDNMIHENQRRSYA